ncbi:MAG: 16S rRNA (cytidine(1402)-2'-O)-methyltransferase [Beijerinckiaceae bacterium]|nr:16S rRNA (cytidine(1402)-2'-O)-methyltransferase [Beijerinckiaceae bacterium]
MGVYFIPGVSDKARPLAPGLYLVATPIGNLRDITLRAIETLAAADIVLAEDKRVSKVLLAHFGISTPLKSYHEHNAEAMRPEIMARLKEGAAIALISDAGTPLISDPGFKLVDAALASGFSVVPVPGASAILAALVAAGLPTDRFFFEGFLPTRSNERKRRIRMLESVPGTLVFFEAPHRVIETLVDLAAIFGARHGAVARELTKRYETVRRGTLVELASQFGGEAAPRGEVVLLVAPPSAEDEAMSDEMIDDRLRLALETLSAKDAAAVVSADLGLQRRQVYARAVALQQQRKDGENRE